MLTERRAREDVSIMFLTELLSRRWLQQDPYSLQKAYLVTFSTPEGQMVLQDLVDRVYATVCYEQDKLAAHNGRRSLVHEILQNIEHAKLGQPSTE